MTFVKGPASRGFSFIEIWMVGMQIPILVGILEYAFLLMRKKYQKCSEPKAKTIDRLTHIGCLIYIILFIVIYILVVLYVSKTCYSSNILT